MNEVELDLELQPFALDEARAKMAPVPMGVKPHFAQPWRIRKTHVENKRARSPLSIHALRSAQDPIQRHIRMVLLSVHVRNKEAGGHSPSRYQRVYKGRPGPV